MRTTLDLDDDLLARVTRLYPPGTSKTVIVEEALRELERGAARSAGPRLAPRQLGFFHMDDPELDELVERMGAPVGLVDDEQA